MPRYVATGPIKVNGVRAYSPGHEVPARLVVEHGYLEAGLVRLDDELAPPPPREMLADGDETDHTPSPAPAAAAAPESPAKPAGKAK